MSILKTKYIFFYLLVYAVAVLHLHFSFQEPVNNFLTVFFILGIGFSLVAWLLTKNLQEPVHKPAFKNEIWFLIVLIIWIIFYITYGGTLINQMLPKEWIAKEQINSLMIFLRKLLFFVIVPFLIYKTFGFSLDDFGLKNVALKLFSKKSVMIFIALSIAALLFQYFLGNGSKPLRGGQFSSAQLIKGLPFCFLYLLFDAGLIEEFFFRGLLQSRLSVLLKSTTGGIVVSAIIFGLVHAPGLYLRGAASEGIDEHLPFLFFASYTIAYMSIAGIFLGVVYSRTKNLWLVMAIHAMVDLFPNFPDFVRTWHI
ncbi:MAG TPA: type II CAAX endopeptidase family protein [Puia sp.]|nr:type II CAAX endopeptidase family protein [Puia sp.]